MGSGDASEVDIDWHFLLLVIIISFLVRFLYIFTLEQTQFYFNDSLQWNQIALNILAGKGFIIDANTMAFRMPLYPLFLSGIYYLFGPGNLFAVRVIQSALSALTCMFIYFIAIYAFSEDKHGDRIGKISLVISSFYPFFIYYSSAMLTETLFIFLLVLFVWFMVRHRYFWAAVFFGLAILCRAEISAFIIFIIIGLFFTMPRRNALRVSVVMVALTCAVISLWVARNYMIFNKFVPFTTMGGWTFWEGNNPQNPTGGPCHYFPPEVSEMDEVQRDEYLKSETIKVIKEDPKRFARLCWSKFKRFWNVKLNTDDARYASSRNNMISMLSFGPILLLSMSGFILSFWNRKNLIFIYFLILYVMLINLAFVSSLRYRLPIEPYLIIFASYSLSILFKGKK